MNCPKCGSFMARLVESHREQQMGAKDELVEKEITHFYNQCNRDGCGSTEADGIEVEERALAYYAVFVDEESDGIALRAGY